MSDNPTGPRPEAEADLRNETRKGPEAQTGAGGETGLDPEKRNASEDGSDPAPESVTVPTEAGTLGKKAGRQLEE